MHIPSIPQSERPYLSNLEGTHQVRSLPKAQYRCLRQVVVPVVFPKNMQLHI